MARQQLPQGFNIPVIDTTPIALSSSSVLMTSFVIQAPQSNTDFIALGNSAGQFHQIAPGRELAVNGDNLDNGTTGYMDLMDWYVVSLSGTQSANVTYLERY